MSPSGWFIRFGGRTFAPGAWHRVAFQPILFAFAWSASVRIIVGDGQPVPFDEMTHGTAIGWSVLSLVSPPLALLSWWLLLHSRRPRAALVGMWTRLVADVGQFVALLVFHLATAFSEGWPDEVHVYTRYIFAAAIGFVAVLIVRDVWALTVMNNLAGRLRGRQ